MSTNATKTEQYLTVGDLPERDRHHYQVQGVEITGYPVMLCCPACGERSSATRGDYVQRRATKHFKCAYDGTPLVLATERTVLIHLTPERAETLTTTREALPGIRDVLQRCYSVISEGTDADECAELLGMLEGLGADRG